MERFVNPHCAFQKERPDRTSLKLASQTRHAAGGNSVNIRHLIVSCVIVAAVLAFGDRAYSADPAIQPGVAYAPNTVLLKFRPGTPGRDKADIRASLGLTLEHSYTIVPGLELLTSKTQDVPQLLDRLSRNPNVEFVEPDYEVSVGATVDDPRFGSLWGIQRIGAPAAWDTTTGSQEYVVAVIDTGVDAYHEDLADNMWVNPGEIAGNGLDDDGNGYIDDVHGYDFVNNDGDPADGHGHGTHVSGTICGRGNNAIGVVGVNWQCRIMGLKFLSDSGSGSTSNAVKALDYAVAKGVLVSNNSWGGGGYSSSLAQALTNAGNAEHLFVAAAGIDQDGRFAKTNQIYSGIFNRRILGTADLPEIFYYFHSSAPFHSFSL